MADIKSPEARSQNMSKIRSADTGPEVWLRKQLFANGYRYRKNVSRIPGRPDIWLSKYNAVIFVHGCFWHRHNGCRFAYTPKSRVEFWTEKFRKNVMRDADVRNQLTERGIRIAVVWECTVKKAVSHEDVRAGLIESLQAFLTSDTSYLEI